VADQPSAGRAGFDPRAGAAVIALLSDRARPHQGADHDHRKRAGDGILLRGSSGQLIKPRASVVIA
jgi:hypothetical protein